MLIKDFENCTFLRSEHAQNADDSMLVTESGIKTEVIAVASNVCLRMVCSLEFGSNSRLVSLQH